MFPAISAGSKRRGQYVTVLKQGQFCEHNAEKISSVLVLRTSAMTTVSHVQSGSYLPLLFLHVSGSYLTSICPFFVPAAAMPPAQQPSFALTSPLHFHF